VNIIGIYRIYESGQGDNIRKSYIEVLGIEETNLSQMRSKSYSVADEELLRDLSRNPNICDMISASIAPAIFGSEEIKKSDRLFIVWWLSQNSSGSHEAQG
jgi:DNA replication licensing factor MCM5